MEELMGQSRQLVVCGTSEEEVQALVGGEGSVGCQGHEADAGRQDGGAAGLGGGTADWGLKSLWAKAKVGDAIPSH